MKTWNLEPRMWNLKFRRSSHSSRLLSVSGASLKRLTQTFKRLRPSQFSFMPVFIGRLLSVSSRLEHTLARAETRRYLPTRGFQFSSKFRKLAFLAMGATGFDRGLYRSLSARRAFCR